MYRRTLKRLVSTLLAVGLALSFVTVTGQSASAAEREDVVDLPVSFQVRNVNESKVPCASDGRTYTVRGHLVAPRSVLESKEPRALTLYLHGLSYTGDSFYHFQGVPGYDYVTEQAKAGHASLEFDLPGYGSSQTVPDGRQLCYGSEATIVHQMIGQLRTGDYSTSPGMQTASTTFQRFALAGHSAAGFTAQAVAYSFDDIDALLLLGFNDQGFTPTLLASTAQTLGICALGGQRRQGDSATTGYAYFGQTPDDYRRAHFHNADPAVMQAATTNRPKDPCGRVGSAPQNIVTDTALLATITVPVLAVSGQEDALFASGLTGTRLQRARFLGSDNVSSIVLPDTGHALTLERSAPQLRSKLASWLAVQRF